MEGFSNNAKKRALDSDLFVENKKLVTFSETSPEDKEEEKKDGIDANQVIFFRLVSDANDLLAKNPMKFQPNYTNQIFGEDEKIFGYKDLIININFTANNFFANIDINYSEKSNSADDLDALFSTTFQGGYYKDKTEFMSLIPMEKNFKPPGMLLQYKYIDKTAYEVRKTLFLNKLS